MECKMQNNKWGLLTFLPLFVSMTAIHFRIRLLILIPVTVVLIFLLVGILPFARRRENLWLFLICAVTFIPINLFALNVYTRWKEFLCVDADIKILSIASTVEVLLILTSVEEVIIGFLGRLIWRRQYKLRIPDSKKEE